MFGEFKRNSCVSGVVPCSGHFGILFVFSTLPTQRRGVNQRSILSRVQFLRGIYTALASRPVRCAVPYFASRFARTAGRTVLYPLPLSLPPTRHTVGDATRPHRGTGRDGPSRPRGADPMLQVVVPEPVALDGILASS